MTPPAATKATTGLLALAFEAAARLGIPNLLVLPEGPLNWEDVRARGGARDRDGESEPDRPPAVRILVAAATNRVLDAARDAGLIAVEVEATEASITERISLALIEAVANEHVSAGDRVVVVYSGFEAETLDSVTVVRLGEHLERLSLRD